MSCSAPIDLIKSQTEKCDLKCKFSFNYGVTNISGKNNGSSIELLLDNMNKAPVLYNNEQYNVNNCMIVKPSLHSYNGSKVDGEILINHSNINSTKDLVVCIPIITGSSNYGDLDLIINQMSKLANKYGEETSIKLSGFSLNKIVPKGDYFSYSGSGIKMFNECNGLYDYIVFNKNNAIKITTKTFDNLNSIISSNESSTVEPKGGVFYNANGPSNDILTGEDDIYIECHPTGEDGEILMRENKDNSLGKGFVDLGGFKNIFNSKVIQVIIGVLLTYALIQIVYYALDKLSSTTITKPYSSIVRNVAS